MATLEFKDANNTYGNMGVIRSMVFNLTEDGWKSNRVTNRTKATISNTPMELTFLSTTGKTGHYIYSLCKSTNTYLESRVLCSGTSCGVTAVRPSLMDHELPNLSPFDGLNTTTFNIFFQGFSEITMFGFLATVTERYIEDPYETWAKEFAPGLLTTLAEQVSPKIYRP